jgi:hypothetical protein
VDDGWWWWLGGAGGFGRWVGSTREVRGATATQPYSPHAHMHHTQTAACVIRHATYAFAVVGRPGLGVRHGHLHQREPIGHRSDPPSVLVADLEGPWVGVGGGSKCCQGRVYTAGCEWVDGVRFIHRVYVPRGHAGEWVDGVRFIQE